MVNPHERQNLKFQADVYSGSRGMKQLVLRDTLYKCINSNSRKRTYANYLNTYVYTRKLTSILCQNHGHAGSISPLESVGYRAKSKAESKWLGLRSIAGKESRATAPLRLSPVSTINIGRFSDLHFACDSERFRNAEPFPWIESNVRDLSQSGYANIIHGRKYGKYTTFSPTSPSLIYGNN